MLEQWALLVFKQTVLGVVVVLRSAVFSEVLRLVVLRSAVLRSAVWQLAVLRTVLWQSALAAG